MARRIDLSKYLPSYAKQAEKLCLLGATDKELGDFFEIGEATINRWKHDFPEFGKALKRGKSIADANVAERLYQRALGFEHDSEEIHVIDKNVVRVKVRKIYPPDTTACIFWLKNRKYDTWRDRFNQDLTSQGKSIQPMSDKQIDKIIGSLREIKSNRGKRVSDTERS